MTTIRPGVLSGKQALLTRATADDVLSKVVDLDKGSNIIVDLSGVTAITPSFLDQFLRGITSMATARGIRPLRIELLAMPTVASDKFAAVGRSYGLLLNERSGHEWVLEEPAA
ncbi:MAG: DUF4325 domain-containing protein [Chloroflexi bacterium]|nr:DUF4325 domain-containing protein [Chloroflexota bacterium]